MSPLPRIGDVYGEVRRYLTRRMSWTTGLWVGVVLAAVLLAAWVLAGEGGWGAGTWWPLLLDALLLAAVAGILWTDRRLRRDWLSEPRLSDSMERSAGLASGLVRSSLELSRSVPEGVSPSLAMRGEQRLVAGLDRSPRELSGTPGRLASLWGRRAVRGLVLLTPVLMLVVVLSPGRSAAAWSGLGRPIALLAPPTLPPLAVEPGDIEVLRGNSVELDILASGRSHVVVHWQTAGDIVRSATSFTRSDRATFTIDGVRAPVDYWVTSADGARSETFVITPIDPLFVNDVTLTLDFPPHTGRASEEFQGDVPPLLLPYGTLIRIQGRASRPLSSGGLVDADGNLEVELDVAEHDFEGSWSPRTSGVFDWAFADATNAPAEIRPPPVDVTLVPDLPPDVRITFPGRDTILPLSLRQPLVMEAQDDYGVGRLQLVSYRVTSLGERQEPVVQSMTVGGNRGVLVRPLLDVSRWGLLPGDTVRYYAEAVDNSPGVQSARTREFVLRMPGAADLRRQAQEELDEAADQLEELAEQAAEAAQRTQDLERQAAGARPDEPATRPDSERSSQGEERIGFEEQEELRQALEDQSRMEQAIDSIQSELQQLSEAMEQAGAADPELSRELQELQDLLEEMAGEEMREQLQEMMERLGEMDQREAQQTLDQLGQDQEELRRQLEESLERFRRAAVEQDFRATTSEAEELAQQEEALAEAMREGDQPELRAEQQDELIDRTEEMEARMQRLEQRLQELGETDAAEEVREAREQSAEARQSMQQAGQQARQQRNQQAGERAEQASQQMQQTADQLQEAQEQMDQQQMEAMREAMEQAAEDALALARRQSELGQSMRGATQDRLAEMRADVAAVQQGVRNMAESVAGASQEAGQEDRTISTRMGEAMEALDRALEALSNQPGSPSPSAASESAVDALNRVALMAMLSAQQQGQGGESSGEQQMQQQLEQLAQQQGQLNNETSQMMPMQLGQQAMQSMMQQMAEGQQSVADELGEMSEQEDENALGDLEALALEAQALAQELQGGRLDGQLRERQERLFHRLLDAGRSLEQEELSEERESAAPGEFDRGEAVPLTADQLGVLRFPMPDAAALQQLTPAARRLVMQYFERLNRSGGGGGG